MLARLRYRLRVRQRTRMLAARARRPSSISDQGAYVEFCARAAADDAAFATFKSNPAYTPILEHVPCDVGARFLSIALDRNPEFGAILDRFRRNDSIGTPTVCDYGAHGTFSATTLRYVKMLSDLVGLFGSLDGLRIAEIGGGYGGQCFVASQVARWESYTIVDLGPCLALAKRYLALQEVPRVHFVSPEQIESIGPTDLVVSNYAFSELTRRFQDRYLDAVVRTASRGYLTFNWMNPKWFRSYTADDLPRLVPGSRLVPEEPLQAKGDVVWIWGSR